MKVVLAEKPSVARDLAAFLDARTRHDGYFEGNGYQVTWALGHLVTLREPQEYDSRFKRWSLEVLPIVPERFELKVIPERRARQQFAIVRNLFRRASELICATDAGREGELIFRYILEMTVGAQRPFQRLWLSSLTPAAIRQAFAQLRPGSDYDRLHAAARCRSQADWIVGLNSTRCFTVRHGMRGLLWSAGRVQTPVLAMIVRRDDEIRVFQPEAFWELLTDYRQVLFKFTGPRFARPEDAEALLQQVNGQPFFVREVQRKEERVLPPLLYDLTELQRDLNRRWGMSAADVLRRAQALYENKLITYPRTDSRYLGSDMRSSLPEVLRRLQPLCADQIAKLDLDNLPFSRRIINDQRVSDHHAILPTGKVPRTLSPQDRKVFDAIVTRLIAAFYPPCIKELTTVNGVSQEVPFRARGARVLQAGWTELYPRKRDQKSEDDQELPEMVSGESGPHQPRVREGQTKPPQHFTENTLLGAMETAGRAVEDDELRAALKDKGLGTPATRAAIIETLLSRQYVQRQQKKLTATDLGRYLIALVQDPALKSAELTGEWEAQLRQIETGRLDAASFMKRIVAYTRKLVGQSDVAAMDESKLGECPLCDRAIIAGKRGYGCSGWRDGCPFVLWKVYKGHELTLAQVRRLLQRHVLLEPMTFDDDVPAVLYLSETGRLLEIPVPAGGNRASSGRSPRSRPRRRQKGIASRKRPSAQEGSVPLGECPVCSAPVQDQSKSYSCSRWREGCHFTIWKTIAGKRISSATARNLIAKGRSSLLKGFRSKSGKLFDARLKIEDGQVRFEFDT